MSAVGDDKLGNEILESFNNRRLNYLIQRVPYPTGTVQIELDEAGIPCYEIKENVAWDNIPFTVGKVGKEDSCGLFRFIGPTEYCLS